MRPYLFAILILLNSTTSGARQSDSLELERLAKMVSLTEVVVRTDINVPNLIDRMRNDTTFYKAFRNLRVLSFESRNDIRILDKKGAVRAGLQSTTRQLRQAGCRSMSTLNEVVTGDFYDRNQHYNYYTAELYASLFFTKDTICGEDNIVSGTRFSTRGKKGLAKHKEQLKLLFFNPGKRIPGIPLMSDRKIDPFDPATSQLYDFIIDQVDYQQKQTYKFTIRAREDLRGGQRDKMVIDEMVTWFDARTMDIMARNYHMSYNAAVYDFDVFMEVELTRFGSYLVPSVLRYKGNWDVALKPRERAVFTATLSGFSEN